MFKIFSGLRNLCSREKGGQDINNYSLFKRMACVFGVQCADSSTMVLAIQDWNRLFQLSKTQVMKTVCHEAAKLVLTDSEIDISSDREEDKPLLKKISTDLENKLSRSLELGIALGGMIIKPTVAGFDLIAPTNFIPISFNSDGDLMSAIFIDRLFKGENIYTRLEYHHFEGSTYVIENKVFVSKYNYDLGSQVSLKAINEWADIEERSVIEGLSKPLFAYFRMPGFNNVDENSCSGISLCSAASEYLLSFDSAFEGFKADLETTRKVIFVNNAAMLSLDKGSLRQKDFINNPIPNLIVGLNGSADQIKEFNPSCNVEHFKTAMQMLLNLISTSCGFTAGYFSFDNFRNAVTATQIESEDQVTVATVISIRKNLYSALNRAADALIDILSLYNIIGSSNYSFSFYARDLSVTPEADRQHTFELVKEGYYPLELYLKEYEGLSEEDIKKYAEKIPRLNKVSE